MIYLVGSMRAPRVGEVAALFRAEGMEVFEDWRSPGPRADEHWREYELGRGRNFLEALNSPYAWNVFEFDEHYLEIATSVVLVCPAGPSAHTEFGWSAKSKPTFALLESENPARWDIMLLFAKRSPGGGIYADPHALAKRLKEIEG